MITLPKKPKVTGKEKNRAIFEIEACYPGYGTTLGSVIRRVLLSSLPGAAITSVKIKGVQHEFSTIPHVIEDVVQIILNLKQVRFKLHTDQSIKVSLKVKGEKEVTAADIKTTSELEVTNPEAHIASLTNKKANLEIEMEIEPGLGYSPVELRKKGKLEVGKIAVDAIFSPVRKVTYSIEHMRVGERTNYDRLKMTIETDGTLTPEDAFQKAAQILVDHFKIFTLLEEKKTAKKKSVKSKAKVSKKIKKEAVSERKKARQEMAKIKLIDLKISAQTANLLQEAGIKTVAGLAKKREKNLEKIEGLGKKRIVEIKRALGKLGLTLKL
ncbi:MAG: DNA-directed RNA polymerase subunit alpha [Candidatus Portnoybacteria bacterium]|nr:DNA-directed RNA polymerase subunit alpha [Candidatus Portnoybacteria bacterium]